MFRWFIAYQQCNETAHKKAFCATHQMINVIGKTEDDVLDPCLYGFEAVDDLLEYNSLESMEVMVNIVARQDFGLEFLAKAKPLRPRPRPTAKATVPRLRPQNLALQPRPRPRTNINALHLILQLSQWHDYQWSWLQNPTQLNSIARFFDHSRVKLDLPVFFNRKLLIR